MVTKEKSGTQSGVKKMNSTKSNSKKNKELIKTELIKESPFTIVTTKGISFGCMGRHKITPDMATKEDVREELKNMSRNRIVQVILLLIEIQK